MSLSVDLASQFAKLTKGDKKQKSEATVYGKTVEYNGRMYVQIDGSELLTPVTTTTDMVAGERVTILIKNHTATVTGNITSPSARTGDVKAVDNRVSELGGKISEFETIIADQVTTEQLNAERARIDELVSTDVIIKKSLTAAEADIDTLQADNVSIKESLTAQSADIETIKADNVTIKETLTAQSAEIDSLKTSKLDASVADITYATIGALDAVTADMTNLESTFGDFKALATDKMTANEADIAELQTNKLSASDIEGKFANIDFSNIGKAAMEHFYSESGLIQNVVVGDATIAGKLVGVTISGDLIEGNTVKAEKLVIKGNDGLYYKLNTDRVTTEAEQTDYNSLDGQVIKAKSITATKISVDDLVAFDATIGGFNITDSAIYSGVKESVDNTTSGVYMDKTGQMAIGDASSFIKYYKDQNGDYHLEISAQSVLMSTSSETGEENIKTVEDAITELSETTSTTANDLSNYISTTNTELENLQDQIDGSITTWFQEYEPTVTNYPASEWATIYDKNVHLGDLFYNTLTGYCYRWQVLNDVYSWNLVKDVDITKAIADAAKAQDTADKKRRVFVSTPTVPYDVGDLWVQGSSGDIMRCNTAKTSSQSYNSTDWVKASKYTDDTKANAAQAAANAAQSGVDALKTRMTSAETEISQNKEAIALRATKTELATTDTKATNAATAASNAQSTADTANSTANSNKTNLANNYYNKTQTDAKIKVESDKISSAVTRISANETAISTLEQTADGLEVRLDTTDANVTTAQNTANTANTNATNAAKTATNFLSYDSTNGLLIGNKTSGSWSGARTQITSSQFNVLDQNGTTLASYGTTTTIGKTSGNNVYIDSDSIDIRRNSKVLATFDQYGLKIANTNDSSGSLGSGATKPALVIGTATGYHIEMDNNEIMAKSDATTSSHLFLNMEGGNVSFNNNANRAMMFQEGALYAKNASFNDGNYLGVLDALNDTGNTVLGYGGYNNKIGGTNIYGNSISLVSNGNIDVEASWINCRSIAPNDNATYALGIYGEKGWSNIYLGKGDNKTNALHIINGSSTYLLCGVNSSGQYVFGNNAAVMYYQAKDVGTDNTGNSFKITSGNNTASNNTNSVWLFGGADTTSRYIGSYMAYSRTYSSAANMCVTANGVFGRSTSSSERYKNSIVEADISELNNLYNLPIKKFKYNIDYISPEDELYDRYLYGFIVEDMEDILPCAVEHIIGEDGTKLPEMWNSNIIIPALLKLIQDLNNRVVTLEKKGQL